MCVMISAANGFRTIKTLLRRYQEMRVTSVSQLLILPLAALLFSCGGGQQAVQEQVVPIAVADTVDFPECKTLKIRLHNAAKLSTLPVVDSVMFDESVEKFIGEPAIVVVKGDTIFAVDMRKAPGIYAYRRDGSQLFAYTSTGQGPEDFMILSDLHVSPTEISAFDRPSNHLFVIDKQGNFKERIWTPTYTLAAFKGDKGDIWVDFSNLRQGDGVQLAWAPPVERTDSMIEVRAVPESMRGITSTDLQTFLRLDTDEVIFHPAFERYIFTVKDGKIAKRYDMDFGDLWWDDEKMASVASSNAWARILPDFPIQPFYVQENQKWLILSFRANREKRYCFIYDKTNDRSRIFIDDDGKYLGIKAIVDDEMYFFRVNDGNLDIISISDIF